MKAQKKPVVIDFCNYDGTKRPVIEWVESFGDTFEDHFINEALGPLKVKTLEGTSYHVTPEDVIIRGVKGEYYPCKRDIFEDTYDVIDEDGDDLDDGLFGEEEGEEEEELDIDQLISLGEEDVA